MNNTDFCYKRATKTPLLSIAYTPLLTTVGKLIFGSATRKSVPAICKCYHKQTKQSKYEVIESDC